MQVPVECWDGCGAEFAAITQAARGSDELIAGVDIQCPSCGHPYKLTVDGDGEADLQSTSDEALGQNISGHGSDEATHY
jgi:DNA-directed RNA polymerase subunit RPC12/RpoP